MRSLLLFLSILVSATVIGFFWLASRPVDPIVFYPDPKSGIWPVQSIDTMKYSRDLARKKLSDPNFDAIIERQVTAIAGTGATHVAVATPYDKEFVPFLKRWVASARAHKLKVWFRGNFSGWEHWFNYPAIGREDHIRKTEQFILDYPELFQDGDIFSSCPECENGNAGDPRQTGDIAGHRAFLVAEYQALQRAFKKINKNVSGNYFSMNADVAKLVMDKATTRALGGIVTIDHYVETPEQLAKDVYEIGEQSGGQVVLGEFGSPLPEVHGQLTGEQQAKWIEGAFQTLGEIPFLSGVNYWVSVGGSTALWDENGGAFPAVHVVDHFFHAQIFFGRVYDDLGRSVEGARIQIRDRHTVTNKDGHFELPVPDYERGDTLTVTKDGYSEQILSLRSGNVRQVVLVKTHKSFYESVSALSQKIFRMSR